MEPVAVFSVSRVVSVLADAACVIALVTSVEVAVATGRDQFFPWLATARRACVVVTGALVCERHVVERLTAPGAARVEGPSCDPDRVRFRPPRAPERGARRRRPPPQPRAPRPKRDDGGASHPLEGGAGARSAGEWTGRWRVCAGREL